jgi:putative ABC transport system substrate-binding protein
MEFIAKVAITILVLGVVNKFIPLLVCSAASVGAFQFITSNAHLFYLWSMNKIIKCSTLLLVFLFFTSCNNSSRTSGMHRIGFLDMVSDETLSQARKGFFMALNEKGFNAKENTEIIYRNAQGDQPTLVQACDYLISQQVELIATCPTLATITAVQKTSSIPVFMMVSPRPDLAGLVDKNGKAPKNLYGVYESLDYLDTAIILVQNTIPAVKKIGTLYDQSQPQSVAALEHIRKRCQLLGIDLEVLPVNNSNETQLVVAALLNKKVDAFFALPDNVVFSSMEVIVKSCDDAHVPVFTSEEGLVKRGAVAAFGADMYHWGRQCGLQAARYLSGDTTGLQPEPVIIRRRVYNAEKAKSFNLKFDDNFFTAVK